MTKKSNTETKSNVTIDIVCIPDIDKEKHKVKTKYELRILNNDVTIRIPIVSGMPPEDILSRLIEILDLTNAEISVDASIKDTITIPVPTPVPYEDPYKTYTWKSPETCQAQSGSIGACAPNNITND